MSQILVSTKYQIVIPKEVRRRFGIKPGQRMSYLIKGGVIHLVPSRPLASLRGFLQGKVTLEGYREKKDRPV